jgi:hypothetical protein
MTTLQGHNAQVALKMFGTLSVADFDGCKVVGEVLQEIPIQSLHVESCQFPVQHYCKSLSIPLCVCIYRPVRQIDVEIIERHSILYGRKDLCQRYLLRGMQIAPIRYRGRAF